LIVLGPPGQVRWDGLQKPTAAQVEWRPFAAAPDRQRRSLRQVRAPGRGWSRGKVPSVKAGLKVPSFRRSQIPQLRTDFVSAPV
jgi:hypothetical protein